MNHIRREFAQSSQHRKSWAMLNRVTIDQQIVIHVIKSVIAACMAAGIAMLLELPQPHTAVVTVFVLMQPLSGMVLAKSFFTGSSEPCSERWRPSELPRIAARKFFWGGETTRAIGNRSAADQPPDSPYEPLAESATTACVLRRALRKNGRTRGCDFVTAIGAGATDHLMPDVMKVEGIMGWMRVTAIAQARGLPVSNHLSRKSART